MPKLPNLSSKRLADFFIKNGFLLDRTTGSHCIYFNSSTKHRAVVPKHNKDLPKGTILSILSEAGLSKDDLTDFFKIS